jgi:Domain of unknown function (DUF3381)
VPSKTASLLFIPAVHGSRVRRVCSLATWRVLCVHRFELEGPASEAPGHEATASGAADAAPTGEAEDLSAVAAAIHSHPATTSEIRTLCADLQVLGRSEFKQLIRW